MESAQALRTLQKKRTSNFREDETKLLIQLWGSPQIQNKLYLTHRKAPVMRMIAANMQQRGFFRTPDEIKTRIRNLKCLYHRIKRSMQSGTGIGTVDPDWPHFKAMDEILSKQHIKKESLYKNNVFDGPRCEDIKQEIEDIDINDDMESYTSNSLLGSDYEDEPGPMPTLTPAPTNKQPQAKKDPEIKTSVPLIRPKPPSAILPNVIPVQTSTANNMGIRTSTTSSLPFPLLILNGVPSTASNSSDKKDTKIPSNTLLQSGKTSTENSDMQELLKNLLDVQKEHLDLDKQRLELDKQRLEFERLVGTQLLTLLPMFGGLLQKMVFNSGATETVVPKNGKKRPATTGGGFGMLRDTKILRTVLEQGIKQYMLEDSGQEDEEDEDEESEIDAGGNNDEGSNDSKM